MDCKVDYIFGMRAVIEALATGKDIDKILVKKDLSGDLSNELFAALKDRPDVVVSAGQELFLILPHQPHHA